MDLWSILAALSIVRIHFDTDANTGGQAPRKACDPLQLPDGPVTSGRLKKFKEALQGVMSKHEGVVMHGSTFGGQRNIIQALLESAKTTQTCTRGPCPIQPRMKNLCADTDPSTDQYTGSVSYDICEDRVYTDPYTEVDTGSVSFVSR